MFRNLDQFRQIADLFSQLEAAVRNETNELTSAAYDPRFVPTTLPETDAQSLPERPEHSDGARIQDHGIKDRSEQSRLMW
jgi:hypothetical protein